MESTEKKLGFDPLFAFLAARPRRRPLFDEAAAGSGASLASGDGAGETVLDPMADADPDQAAGSGGGARTMARSWRATGSTSLA